MYKWYKEAIKHLPLNSVIVIDNASIHNKRAPGTPKASTYKADMQHRGLPKVAFCLRPKPKPKVQKSFGLRPKTEAKAEGSKLENFRFL